MTWKVAKSKGDHVDNIALIIQIFTTTIDILTYRRTVIDEAD